MGIPLVPRMVKNRQIVQKANWLHLHSRRCGVSLAASDLLSEGDWHEALCKVARGFTRYDPLLAKEIQDPRLLLMISHMLMMWASNIFPSPISVPCISFLSIIGQNIGPYAMGNSHGDHVKSLV